MIVGIFHPVINLCGGAEWVAINIIETLKQYGHRIVLLTDQHLNQKKIMDIYGKKVDVDTQIIFPFAFFPPTDNHNIYTDAVRGLILKSKCDIIIDTSMSANSVLPKADMAYIHYPFLKSLVPNFKNKLYFLPYHMLARISIYRQDRKIFFANSKFTSRAVEETMGIRPHVLYPPISTLLYNRSLNFDEPRNNVVVTVARISMEKNLTMIPQVAKLTNKKITFLIIGILDSQEVLQSILRMIRELKVSERVKILTNIKRENLKTILLKSKVYFHPAINEHFGVSIVEAMASGCIPVVNNSGGPKEFVPRSLRYERCEEAAEKVEKAVFEWSPKYSRDMVNIAYKFHESEFAKKFIGFFNSMLL